MHSEGAVLVFFAFHFDAPTVGFDYVLQDRQAQPNTPHPDGEQRLEQLAFILFRDAKPMPAPSNSAAECGRWNAPNSLSA